MPPLHNTALSAFYHPCFTKQLPFLHVRRALHRLPCAALLIFRTQFSSSNSAPEKAKQIQSTPVQKQATSATHMQRKSSSRTKTKQKSTVYAHWPKMLML
jgi:hypothetical protein